MYRTVLHILRCFYKGLNTWEFFYNIWAHKTSLTLPLFIEMPVLSQESERWCIMCDIISVSTICLQYSVSVSTLCYFLFLLLLLYHCNKRSFIISHFSMCVSYSLRTQTVLSGKQTSMSKISILTKTTIKFVVLFG